MTGINRKGQACGLCERLGRRCGRCRGEIEFAAGVSTIDDANLNAAFASGVELDAYRDARAVGATHEDVVDAHGVGIGAEDYTRARAAGATHDEVMAVSAFDPGLRVERYGRGRMGGATHQEALDMAKTSVVTAETYEFLRGAGASHRAAMQRSVEL